MAKPKAKNNQPITMAWARQYTEVVGDCWIWRRALAHGYARVTRGGKTTALMRVLVEQRLGRKLRKGEVIRHRCHNRGCIRLSHLAVGTQLDNMRDMVKANRSAKGERHSQSTLRDIDVLKIRYLSCLGMKQCDIARIVGTTTQNVSKIVLRTRWKHL